MNWENASGYSYCLTDEDRPSYPPIESMESGLRAHMDGYMRSAGHRANILYPWHRKVSLGLAWDTHQMWTVQHFEGDYVDCSVPPTIQGTTLVASCATTEVFPSHRYAQQIYYNPPPHELTQGQIARSYGYKLGRRVALLRQRAPAGRSYSVNEETLTHYSGCTPYEIDPSAPPPSSPDEARSLFEQAKLCEPVEETITVPWIDGEGTISGSAFTLSHDIGQVLSEHGKGVYTLAVWGCSTDDSINPCGDGNSFPILQESIFYGIDPPDTYTPQQTTPTQREDCGSAVTDTSNAGLIADCETLLGLKDTLRGSIALNWSSTLPIGEWKGIWLGGTPQRVTNIMLQKMELDGSIPAGIGDLAKLQNIWLYRNELTGPLPAELGNLSELKTLMLSWNKLSGQIPEELNNLTLDRLWLKGNDFTGCIPAKLLEVPDGDADQLNLPACESETSPPTDEELLEAYLFEANCTAEDLLAAFGERYTLRNSGGFVWEHNGRGWWASVNSYWVNDNDPLKGVGCMAIVYDNESSAILDSNYHSVRLYNRWLAYDTQKDTRIPGLPTTGHTFKVIQFEKVQNRLTNYSGADVWTRASGTTSSMYRRGNRAVIVSATIYRELGSDPIHFTPPTPPSPQEVVEISRRIDARLAESEASAASYPIQRDSKNVSTQGLQKAEDVLDSDLHLDTAPPHSFPDVK